MQYQQQTQQQHHQKDQGRDALSAEQAQTQAQEQVIVESLAQQVKEVSCFAIYEILQVGSKTTRCLTHCTCCTADVASPLDARMGQYEIYGADHWCRLKAYKLVWRPSWSLCDTKRQPCLHSW